MAKKMHHIEIHPAENGGHTVQHHFHHEMRRSGSAHSGMMMDQPEAEHHVFGPDEGHEMLAHVANHLHIPTEGKKGRKDEEEDERDEAEPDEDEDDEED